jgi:UDP-galactopyranose mutase
MRAERIPSLTSPDLIVVGSGFFGATVAERAATILNKKVLVLEKRSHIGGNAFSFTHHETGIEIHKYGLHIFHTSNKKVIEYISQFTEFNDYRHKVLSRHKGEMYSMPINLKTIRKIFGQEFTSTEAEDVIKKEILDSGILELSVDANLRNKAISLVGPTLYEALITGYTKKQWQEDPEDLPASIITRLPVRFNLDDNYYFDDFQGIPKSGYADIFVKMLDHPNITVLTDTDYFDTEWARIENIPTIYTGPIDQYFEFEYGELDWRTLDFHTEVLPVRQFQEVAAINEADEEVAWIRTLEYRHLQAHQQLEVDRTVVTREYSRKAESPDEFYYPVNTSMDREKLLKYRELSKKSKNVIFGGRLGTYQYLDMHMAIGSALTCFENEIVPRLS